VTADVVLAAGFRGEQGFSPSVREALPAAVQRWPPPAVPTRARRSAPSGTWSGSPAPGPDRASGRRLSALGEPPLAGRSRRGACARWRSGRGRGDL